MGPIAVLLLQITAKLLFIKTTTTTKKNSVPGKGTLTFEKKELELNPCPRIIVSEHNLTKRLNLHQSYHFQFVPTAEMLPFYARLMTSCCSSHMQQLMYFVVT